MRIRVGILLIMGLLGASPVLAQKPDSGKFVIQIQGTQVGTTTFKTDKEGGTTFDQDLNLGGNKAKVHAVITAKGGKIGKVEYEATPGGKYLLNVQGAKSTVSVNGAKEKPFKLADKIYLFDNFAPHVLSGLLRAYDSKKGGSQKFDCLLLNNAVPMKVNLSSRGTKPRKAGGKMVSTTNYLLSITGGAGTVEIEVFADADFRVLMWNVASQKYKAWREGYQDLAKADEVKDPLLSKPTHKVSVERKVRVPMRDGVVLIADVYRPKEEGKYPVILQRTPYGRTNAFEANYYAERGYVFVAQDVRGKFDSQGVFEPFVNEAQDGHDTVEWCGTQAWSDGNVGMIGGSYLGFVQWAAAREGSSYLKCLIPIVSPPDPFFNIPYAFGAFFYYPSLWWAAIVKDRGMNAPRPLTNFEKFYTLPIKDTDKALFGKTIPFYQKWLQNATNNSYWDKVNFNERMKNFKPLPALHVSGWFDGDGIGTKRNYAYMLSAGQKNQKLVYGPWPHAVNSVTQLGELSFGSESLRDLDTLYLRWFDRWLKGIENGVDKEPPVEAFLMGKNQWRKFSTWPPTEASMQKWYLHSTGHANGAKGDGTLSKESPSASEKPDRFVYDPAKPYMPHSFQADLKAGKENSTLDASADEQGVDRLLYTSEPLKTEVVVAGPISLRLTAETSAKDTDWFAYVSDVFPDGKSITLVQGIVRARFRHSFAKPTLLKPGEVGQYDIDLWALGHVFQKGHRIRVLITSSCFPVYDRNLNTGEEIATATRMVKANQTVFHQPKRESYLLLPVLPR